MADFTVTPYYTTKNEIQDSALRVGGDGTIYGAYMRADGSGAEVHIWSPTGAHTMHMVHTPPDCSLSGVAVAGSGTYLLVQLTGHNVTQPKPRDNYLGIARIPNVFTPNMAEQGDGPGAWSPSDVVPPVVPSTLTVEAIADAVRTRVLADVGGDTLRHAEGALSQASCTAAIIAAFKDQGDPAVYQGVTNMIYGVLQRAGVVK